MKWLTIFLRLFPNALECGCLGTGIVCLKVGREPVLSSALILGDIVSADDGRFPFEAVEFGTDLKTGHFCP